MALVQWTRRRLIQCLGSTMALATSGCFRREASNSPNQTMITLYTFGDSILDCGRYNEFGIHPGQLLVQNHDRLFPEFQGQDLVSWGPARLEHRAQDGATVRGLPAQAQGLQVDGPAIALITVGGNDLLQGLVQDTGPGIVAFGQALEAFVQTLPIRPVLIGTVYDPTAGEDSRNFLGIDAGIARRNLQRINETIAAIANRHGVLVDLQAHFLMGDLSWFTSTIEPSLRGASEVRRAFWPHVLAAVNERPV